MSERKLAHIERVIKVEPIEGADRIELATVLGWQCVVKKDSVKVNDKVVYIEIDSLIKPDKKWSCFLMEKENPLKLIRIKTRKFKGVISQGLCLPLSILDEIEMDWKKLEEGTDVTDVLGITKWLSPSEREVEYIGTTKKKHNLFIKYMTRYQWFKCLFHIRSKSFPEWIRKTDEERIQNIPWILTKYKDTLFYKSEKLDGQSATYWYKHNWLKPEFGICSRTVRKSELDNSNWSKIAKQLKIKNILKDYYNITKTNLAIQGEIIGPSIQGNKYNLSCLQLYIFNIYDIDKKEYFDIYKNKWFCSNYNLNHVPILDYSSSLKSSIKEMVEDAKGISTLLKTDREGLVWRNTNMNISFKVTNPDFLIRNNE